MGSVLWRSILLGAMALAAYNADADVAQTQAIGERYQVIDFERGTAQLSDSERERLRALIGAARAAGDIDAVHVAVWPDENLKPNRPARLPRESRRIAKERARILEMYLERDLRVRADTFNLAERTNFVSRYLNADGQRLDRVFSADKDTPVSREEMELIRQMGGPGKAVVIVDIHGDSVTSYPVPATECERTATMARLFGANFGP